MSHTLLLAAAFACLAVAAGAQSYGGYGRTESGTYGSYGSSQGSSQFGPGPSSCNVTAYLTQPWPLWSATSSHASSVNIFVVNKGDTTIPVPWELTISNPAYKSIEQYPWNWDYAAAISGGKITGQAKRDWQALVPGASVNLGAVVGADSTDIDDFKPQSATVNGVSCSVTTVTG